MIIKYLIKDYKNLFLNNFTNQQNSPEEISTGSLEQTKLNGEYSIEDFLSNEVLDDLSNKDKNKIEELLKDYNKLYTELKDREIAGTIPKQRLYILKKGLEDYRIDSNEDKVERQDIELIAENTKEEAEIYGIIIGEIEKELEYIKNEIDMVKYINSSKETNLNNPELTLERIDDLIKYFESEDLSARNGGNREGDKSYIELCLDTLYDIRFSKEKETKSQELYNELNEKDPKLQEVADYTLKQFLEIPIEERLKYVTLERKDFSEILDNIDNGTQVDLTISFDYGGEINSNLENGLNLFMILPENVGKVYVGDKEYIRNSRNGQFIGEDGKPLEINEGMKISLKPEESKDNLDSFIGQQNELIVVKDGKEIKYEKVEGIFRKDGKNDGDILQFNEPIKIKIGDKTFEFSPTTIRSEIELKQNQAYLDSISNESERLGEQFGLPAETVRDLGLELTRDNVEGDIGYIGRTLGDVSKYTKENVSKDGNLLSNLVKLIGYLFPWAEGFLNGMLGDLESKGYGSIEGGGAFEGAGGSKLGKELAEFCKGFTPRDGQKNWCSRNVGDALEAFGKIPNVGELRGHGADWGTNLAKRSDFTEVTDVYDVMQNPPPAGAIISYQRNSGGSSARQSYGHVEVALGDGRYFFGQIASGPGGSNRNPKRGTYRIFLPGTPIESSPVNSPDFNIENLSGNRKKVMEKAMTYYDNKNINGAAHCTDWVKKIYEESGIVYYGKHNMIYDNLTTGIGKGTGLGAKNNVPVPDEKLNELQPGDSIDVDFNMGAGFNSGRTHTAMITENLGNGKVKVVSYPNGGQPPKIDLYDLKTQKMEGTNRGVRLIRARQPR